MKPKPAEILLRLTTEIDLFNTDNLLDRPDTDGVSVYRGEIFVADGVDEYTITEGAEVEHARAGEILAFLIDIELLLSAPKRPGEQLEDVLADYGLSNDFTNRILHRVKDNELVLGRKIKPARKIMYVARIKLSQDYRNRDVGIFALSGCIERVADKDTMVLIPLKPLQFSGIEPEAEDCMFYTSRIADATASLTKHFQKLMFQPLPIAASEQEDKATVMLYRPAVMSGEEDL